MAWRITERDSPRGPVIAHGVTLNAGEVDQWQVGFSLSSLRITPGSLTAHGALVDGKFHDELDLKLPATIDWVETPAS